MYKIEIKTKYNTIHLEVDDYNTPEVQEIFNQPYVEEITMHYVEGKAKKLVRKDGKQK